MFNWLERIDLARSFDYDVHDVAVAFTHEVIERFGKNPFGTVHLSWRHRKPPTLVTVKTGYNKEENIYMGPMTIRGISGFFVVGDEGQPQIQARVRRTQQKIVEDLLCATHERLETQSIYRGKALVISSISQGAGHVVKREFMDLSGVSLSKLGYNAKVLRDLDAHVWTILEHREQCATVGIRLQRKILFKGPFGSGKTLAAFLTAQKAIKNKWTSFYIVPTSGRSASAIIDLVLMLARRYRPSMVLIEDIDREQRDGDPYALGRIMTAIDGFVSKTNEILIVMTTNHADRITAGMQRPGRIDKIIHFEMFTSEDIIALLKKNIPTEMIQGDINWEEVAEACHNYTPVFVEEIGISAKLMAIQAANGGKPYVTQEMLLERANDLRQQHETCAKETMGFQTPQPS